jgi:hypothetical protein
MRRVAAAGLKAVWAAYLLLTSLYSLLTFIPYTYCALIKAPAYAWMPAFARRHAACYWLALLALAAAHGLLGQFRRVRWYLGCLAAAGVALLVHPVLAKLESNSAAYQIALLSAALLVVTAMLEVWRNPSPEKSDQDRAHFDYLTAAVAAVLISVGNAIGAHARLFQEAKRWKLGWLGWEVAGWSLLSHVVVALLVITFLNALRTLTARSAHPARRRGQGIGVLLGLALAYSLNQFLAGALSFEGWPARIYAGWLALALVTAVWDIVACLRSAAAFSQHTSKLALAGLLVMLGLAMALPTLVGEADWDGIVLSTFSVALWLSAGVALYQLRPIRGTYRWTTLAGVAVFTLAAYATVYGTAFLWAKALGNTQDEVSRSLESYAAHDASFRLAHHLLGHQRTVDCGDLCRILRSYTNIRDARLDVDVNLVDHFQPADGPRPNIFIFVIDSMRPDYLGAYNPNVNFTPNLDAFAREGFAIPNVFTQYAGTTLSEPAIWSGTLLLHAHYMQPFSRVNNLEKLARGDGYQMVLSYDTVLSQIVPAPPNTIKLDEDKPLWNQFEVCSTIEQTEQALDARPDKSKAILFYSQPMNVHQFAQNKLPGVFRATWNPPDGFSQRISYQVHQVDECLGRFFQYLKTRGLYDNSIIVVTSDHGDATGKYGRYSHSLSIYPEVMRVPLLMHLPENLRRNFHHDASRITTLTDLTPTLYELLGHGPVKADPIFGIPIFLKQGQDWSAYPRHELLLASDVRAAYGILADDGRYLYATYDYPTETYLFDLSSDPHAEHNLVNDQLKKSYDERLIGHLHQVGDFYGYKPGVGMLLASSPPRE